ncbi:hypothetical protein, partial [Holdemanella porci]|uniref:hypothetical protein n=1 Tax=Holdemanella porci TaxID=2652276 RepID=UPI003AF0914F
MIQLIIWMIDQRIKKIQKVSDIFESFLFYIKILVSEQGNAACEKLSNCHNLLIMRNDKKDYRNS